MEAVLDGLLAMPATLPSFLVEAFLASVMAERELAGLKPELPEHDAVSMRTPVFQTLLESSCLAAGNPRFGLLVGNPTLWTISFSYLVALLPIWWDGRFAPVRQPQPPHPAPGSHATPVRA